MPGEDISKQLRYLADQLKAVQARLSIFEADTDSMPPVEQGPLFADAKVIHSFEFPRCIACLWTYDVATNPIPAGWEEATELRGVYVAGLDPADGDYDVVGVGTNTNGFTGYKLHGVTENNHSPHWHTIAGVGGTLSVTTVNISYIHSAGGGASSATVVTAVDPSGLTVNPTECPTGGLNWCDAESDTDNRPPTFVAIWIRRPLLP